jgi:hypothetical protein
MKKEGWPNFPFWWETRTEWNMSSLRDIASHLEQKTSAPRQRSSSSYRGEATDMEKQIFQHIGDLEQRVSELEDALQALLQIIDDNRPSQKIKRLLKWVLVLFVRFKQSLQESATYWILGLLGVLGLLYGVAKHVFNYFSK